MIIVFGSIHMDMHLPVDRFPVPGETVLSSHYDQYAGGKGANQALAAARVGVRVALVGRVGDDGMGMRMLAGLRRSGVNTSGVAQSPLPTGLAVVIGDRTGENQVIVSVGANADIRDDQIPDEILTPKNMLLLQMETPPAENWKILERAKKRGVKTMLNLAPAINIPQAALENLDYLIVNQIEARMIAAKLGIDMDKNAAKLAQALAVKGNLTCIVTQGPQGSVAVDPAGTAIRAPSLKLETVVDTTGSGDAYCGTLAALLHEGKPLEEAMRMASVAGALTCTKRGTQDAFPYIGEVEEKLAMLG